MIESAGVYRKDGWSQNHNAVDLLDTIEVARDWEVAEAIALAADLTIV